MLFSWVETWHGSPWFVSYRGKGTRKKIQSLFDTFKHKHGIFSARSCFGDIVDQHFVPGIRLLEVEGDDVQVEGVACVAPSLWKKMETIEQLNPVWLDYDHNFIMGRGTWVAQRKHSCFPPGSPGFKSQLCQDFLSLLLSLWTVLRLKPIQC